MRGALKPNQGIRLVMKEHGVEFWMAAEFTFLSERSFRTLMADHELDEETLNDVLAAIARAEAKYHNKKQ